MKIVFLDEYTVDQSDLTPIKSLGAYTGYSYTEPEQILERCAGADVVITNKTPFKADIISRLEGVKLICVAATGMNNIDLDAAKKAGIEVRNAVDYSTDSVAELTFAGVFALLRQILYYDNFVKQKQWAASGRLFDFTRPTHELRGKNWGIIGLGNIGARVASLATAFGCEVAYYSTSGRNADSRYRRTGLQELLGWADIVSVHAPLNKDTYHLIDADKLALMKPSAIISNMARGSLIDEAALARALDNGIIAGAAIDVYSEEPVPDDNPLLGVTDKYRLLFTPHTGFSTQEALQRVVERVAGNIREFYGLS